jgi:cytochrome oxidase assembly protein ShyY1
MNPKIQYVAFIIAFVSMIGFMLIFWQVGKANEALAKIARIDMVAILLLVASIILIFDQDSLVVS